VNKNHRKPEYRATEFESPSVSEPVALVMPVPIPGPLAGPMGRLRKALKLSDEVSEAAMINEAAERLTQL
jgi:hypothetical protein